MGLKHRTPVIIPQPSSHWTFNEPSGPIIDKGGFANFTATGGSYNGTSIQFGGVNSYFQTAAGAYGKPSCFSMFGVFKPNATDPDFDIFVMGSGTGFSADDYTWYFDTNSSSNGFYFGVSPGSGDYGNQLMINTGTIDTTKKHWVMFGYQASASGNKAFLFLRREGDNTLYAGTSNNLSPYSTNRNFYLSNSGYHAGGTISVDYYRALYWENQYLQNAAIFNALCNQYAL